MYCQGEFRPVGTIGVRHNTTAHMPMLSGQTRLVEHNIIIFDATLRAMYSSRSWCAYINAASSKFHPGEDALVVKFVDDVFQPRSLALVALEMTNTSQQVVRHAERAHADIGPWACDLIWSTVKFATKYEIEKRHVARSQRVDKHRLSYTYPFIF
jgi:hypothetical protein